MTVPQILEDLKPVKPISRETLYQYFKKFGIKPLGIRQCPQRFPDDASLVIRLKLGLPRENPSAKKRAGTSRGANLKRSLAKKNGGAR